MVTRFMLVLHKHLNGFLLKLICRAILNLAPPLTRDLTAIAQVAQQTGAGFWLNVTQPTAPAMVVTSSSSLDIQSFRKLVTVLIVPFYGSDLFLKSDQPKVWFIYFIFFCNFEKKAFWKWCFFNLHPLLQRNNYLEWPNLAAHLTVVPKINLNIKLRVSS